MLKRRTFCVAEKNNLKMMDKINNWRSKNPMIKIIQINTQLKFLNRKQEFQGALVEVPILFEFVWIYYEE